MENITRMMNFRKMISRLKDWKFSAKISFFVLGIASTLWFLIRVIPKPSRASYPCMRAAAPIMSGFIVYLLSISISVFAFRKFGKKVLSAKYYAAAGFLAIAITLGFVAGSVNSAHIKAAQIKYQKAFIVNSPIGTPSGYWPGRVVWVYDAAATNKNCTNTSGDYWYDDANTDQEVVRTMLANGIRKYSDTTTLAQAWDCMFKYFNIKHNRGSKGYTAGEKIVIKVNMTNMSQANRDLQDQMNATPQLMLALLEELIDTIGVAQADITIGDPYRSFADVYYNLCHTKYMNVHYIDGSNADGRELTKITSGNVFFTSDIAQPFASRLPQAYMEATYLINMPCMKSHNSAGITLAAKNHQGSVIGPDQDAGNQLMQGYLHYDYPDNPDGQVLKKYRHLVDYMVHSKLGGNTLVYIVDAIWSGRNWMGIVDKWGMPPFNGDFTSSLFISQDPVATESVGYDFLFNEYNNDTYKSTYHQGDDFPTWAGIEDYILQAADSINWPTGITYDPDHDIHQSRHVRSLGVYEHWNSIANKQYSVNLTGNKGGIDLVTIPSNLVTSAALNYTHEDISSAYVPVNIFKAKSVDLSMTVYPNPVRESLNVEYNLPSYSNVTIDLIASNGIFVANLLHGYEDQGTHSLSKSMSGLRLVKGQYICRIISNSNGTESISIAKLEVL